MITSTFNRAFASLLLICLGICILPAAQAGIDAHLEWREGKPTFVATLSDFAIPEGAKDYQFQVDVQNLSNQRDSWRGNIKFDLTKGLPATAELALGSFKDLKVQHSVTYSVNHPASKLRESETWTVGQEANPVPVIGLRRMGYYPSERVELVLGMNGFEGRDLQPIPLTMVTRDGDDNVVQTQDAKLTVAATPTWQRLDIRPKEQEAVGPFTVEFGMESESPQLYFSSTLKFGYANSAIPVTSLESDDAIWIPSNSEDPFRQSNNGNYYSKQFMEIVPQSYPAIDFPTGNAHSGERAMRIRYNSGETAHVFSQEELPGMPLTASIWVYGNNSQDELFVQFVDHVNLTLQAWIRNASFRSERVCVLNFEGWQKFDVPVLGEGVLVPGKKGSTEELDAPVSIMAFSVVCKRLGRDEKSEPRSVLIDDISVETESHLEDRLSLELQLSNPNGDLDATTTLLVTVGNGAGVDLETMRVSLTARDADAQTIWTSQQPLTAKAGAFVQTRVALAELAAKVGRGPFDLDVVVTDAKNPGLRVADRVTLKHATERAVFLDFEEPDSFNGFEPGKTYDDDNLARVAGGADGKGHALELTVRADNPKNSVILHPALPGMVDYVDVMIQGGSRPVTLQPWYIDSGFTGIWNRPYNIFWLTPIVVDWQGWKKVRLPAPAVSPFYEDPNRYFFQKPWYPLNLAFNATVPEGSGEPVKIRLDDVVVQTHLPAAETLTCDVTFADESHIHQPGSPLSLMMRNYAADPATLSLEWSLRSYQGHVAESGTLPLVLAAGVKQNVELVKSLKPGLYDLEVRGLGGEKTLRQAIIVLDAKAYFGESPETTLKDLVTLRKSVGKTSERVYLDWDNTEPVPNLFHYNWFRTVVKGRNGDGAFNVLPVLGFSADWAGRDAQERIAAGNYLRSFPNYLQIPERTIDWSQFVRECLREYHKDYDTWVFWENPDLDDAPQGIPPARYPELIAEVYRWVKLYLPNGKVVAGGFNFNKALNYLDQIPDPAALQFDEFAVQMNFGELSPEQAGLEAFLDDLSETLDLKATKRTIRTTELDWGIGEYVSARQQAAYHVRASMILNARGASDHEFSLVNGGDAWEGYGNFYRERWGNSDEVQIFKPWYIPKPAYFAIVQTQKFLKDWQLQDTVALPDRSLDDDRAYIYRDAAGRLCVAIWRTAAGERSYSMPSTWKGVEARDAFGYPLANTDAIVATALPFFYTLPAGYELATLRQELRLLTAVDGTWPVAMDLHLSEPESCTAVNWQGQGKTAPAQFAGVLPGGRKIRESGVQGLTSESFTVKTGEAGTYLLRRLWYFDGSGSVLHVKVGDGPETTWDLSAGQDNAPGPRSSTYILRDLPAGDSRITLRYETPGNAIGYRLEPAPADHIPLVRFGVLNSRQSVGTMQNWTNAGGTALKIGKTTYADGIGAHAVSFIEYPLDGAFKRLSVTVGIDGETEGRGSVVFRIYADDKEVANSGTMNGFSAAKTLEVNDLTGVRRLILSVQDGADGTAHDLANWVDGKLYW